MRPEGVHAPTLVTRMSGSRYKWLSWALYRNPVGTVLQGRSWMRALDVFKVVKDVPNKRVIQAKTWLEGPSRGR